MSDYICPPDHKHGENLTCRSRHHCKCDECRTSEREYQFWRDAQHRRGKELLVDATGTRRRIQALGAMGHSRPVITRALGYTSTCVASLLNRPRVRKSTAEKVKLVYDELSMTPPNPQTRDEKSGVTRAKMHAKRQGWVPPLAWDDDTIDDPNAEPMTGEFVLQRDDYDEAAVDQALSGVKIELTRLERREAIRRLYWRKWSDVRIARLIGGDPDSITKMRNRMGLKSFPTPELEPDEWAA